MDWVTGVMYTQIKRWVYAWVCENPDPCTAGIGARRDIKRYDIALSGVVSSNWIATHSALEMTVNEDIGISDDRVYRISIESDGVKVLCLGMASVDGGLDGIYDGVNALPDWVQERIAVLMMTKSDPPTHEVVGLGRRISKNVFWVYTPEQ